MINSKSAPRVLYFFLIALLSSSCSTYTIYSRGALFEMVLRPYPYHESLLVNQSCTEYKDNKCIKADVVVFNLKKEEDKKQLVDLKFICNVAGARFGICLDSPGLCQTARIGKRPCIFCPKKTVVVKRLDIETDFQYILNANTVCAAQDSFMGKRLFN